MDQKIVIKIGKLQKAILISEILYIKAENVYSELHFANGEKILIAKTIADFEEQLSGMKFFRIHRSYLVNLRNIESFTTQPKPMVSLKGGIVINVSRYRVSDFRQCWKIL